MNTASRILVRGGQVLCGVDSAGDAEIVTDGAVLVEGGTVAAIDRFERLRMLHPECAVIGSDRALVSPGFVNAHHHVGLTPFQLGAPDLPLEMWLAVKIGLREIDPYLDTLYSAFEMIASGVTTVQHLHVSRGNATRVETQAEAILRAYRTIGMRVSYSYGYRDQNLLAYEDDEVFLSRLPKELADEAKPWFTGQRIPLTEHLAFVEQMVSSTCSRCRWTHCSTASTLKPPLVFGWRASCDRRGVATTSTPHAYAPSRDLLPSCLRSAADRKERHRSFRRTRVAGSVAYAWTRGMGRSRRHREDCRLRNLSLPQRKLQHATEIGACAVPAFPRARRSCCHRH